MVLSQSQWAQAQAKLPSEDRVSYADYVQGQLPTTTAPAFTDPAALGRYFGGVSATPTPAATSTKAKALPEPVVTPKVITQEDVDAAVKTALDNQAKSNAASVQQQKDLLKQQQQANTTTAVEDFRASLQLAGLNPLADVISNMILQDKTAAQIRLEITQTPEYASRFPGMAALQKQGKAVNEATYISMERGFDQIMRANGLDVNVFGTTTKLGELIGNLVSPTEFENRVNLAVDHVNKQPDVLAALKDYYGISAATAVSYVLDPKLGMDIVTKEVRAAEIGAAATAGGFKFDKSPGGAGALESYIPMAGMDDLNSLKQTFGKARILADTQARLAQIEGGKYGELSAVNAVLGKDSQELLASQQRAEREAARFSGGSGVTGSSLKQASNI
jgi:hypothetical protein